jgi:hypothetical protein
MNEKHVEMRSDAPGSQQQTLAYWRLQSGHTSSQDFAFLEPLKPTVVFETYWRFAAERQAIFFRRLEGRPAPWTDDPILQQHKFTNAYRASDRVSQYLIRHVIYEGDPEPLLFKLFNRIETWNTLKEAVGEIRYRTYAFSAYDSALSSAVESGERIYSPAYIMPSSSGFVPSLRLSAIGTRRNGILINWLRKEFRVFRVFEAATADDVWQEIAENFRQGGFNSGQAIQGGGWMTLLLLRIGPRSAGTVFN